MLGAKQPSALIKFEEHIEINGHTCFIDGWIEKTKVLIENKSRGIDLDKPAQQSDKTLLTPFEQAKRYADRLPRLQQPHWIVVCNFDEFRIYDISSMPLFADVPPPEPAVILFKHLTLSIDQLKFLIDEKSAAVEDVKISKNAVENIERIREGFARKMLRPRRFKPDDHAVDALSVDQKNILNAFCVRLVFCLYAEDAALFKHNQFVDYIRRFADSDRVFDELFDTLNTPLDRRDPNLPVELKQFPYVNGGLFADGSIDIPPFDVDMSEKISLQARQGSDDRKRQRLNWFTINPTVFGALFESGLNDDRRRAGGMHYTSVENIHRVIDPLFMDALLDEFQSIKRRRKQNRRRPLEDFQDKLASLTFLDPACGSGNFLTETYISLRRLENEVIDELIALDVPCTIKVSIDQFYGIEIYDFACAIAQTALWIAESQMFYDTDIVTREKTSLLPLKHSARIVCGNALRIDWHEVVPEGGVDYIIGNPPFIGFTYQSDAQKADLQSIFPKVKNLDYVCCWFKKAADFMAGNGTRAAFVSTNSICQGETVARLAPALDGVHIDFAHRTFKWTIDDDALNKAAAVHCAIVGFSHAPNTQPKIIFDGDDKIIASNINWYLFDAPDVIVSSRNTPLSDVPNMVNGSTPRDDGNLIIEADDYEQFVRREPKAQKFIRRYVGADEFINGKNRYVLWLKDATEDDLRLPLIAERIEAVRRFRLASKRAATRKDAATPHLFSEIRQPTMNYILLPSVSSERRQYVPMDFMKADVVVSNLVHIIPDGGLFEFGVLESSVHMGWMRTICGRLESRYRYSRDVVYNNFPWCARVSSIEQTAQRILDARELYPDWTLAALYDPNEMPLELRAAHDANDQAVMSAYGFDPSMSEAEIVARLMDMYQRLTAGASTDKIAN